MKRMLTAILSMIATLAIAQQEFNASRPDDGATPENLPAFERTYSLTGTWMIVQWTDSMPFRVASIDISVNTTNALGMTNVFTLIRNRTTAYDGATNTWWSYLVNQGVTNAHTVGIEPFAFTINQGDWFMLTNTQAGLNVTLSAGKR